MPAVNKEVRKSTYSGIIANRDIKDHANDPYVLKKIEKAKQMVNKFGLPGDKKK